MSTPDQPGAAQAEPRETRPPVLRVVRGDATPEEVAAVLAAIAAVTPPPTAPARATSAWADRGRLLRRGLAAGPGAWRASGLPG